jgi:hypothetical protein
MRRAIRKSLVLALPASLLAVLVAILAIEVWVRMSWDHRRGTPGFLLSDAARGQRLAPGYEGWFAGVPVRINALGFRDPRDYSVEKRPGTFRIIVLGDSVTFGHGAVYETTYPFLLEERLKQWRPDVTWEVWNLAVPGYNTRQELTHLREIGPRFQPDLVVVGFYPNDYTGNESSGEPGWVRRAGSAVVRTLQRQLYSFEFFKRAFLTLRWRLLTKEEDRKRLEHLATEGALLNRTDPVSQNDQSVSAVDYFDAQEVRDFVCHGLPRVDPRSPGELKQRIDVRAPDVAPWLDAVEDLQNLARQGVYRIVFFINGAPEICRDQDRFYNGGSLADERALVDVLGRGTPVVSSVSEFLHYRPSQMPVAGGHSVGNSNRVKADVLFDFLKHDVLPPVLPTSRSSH